MHYGGYSTFYFSGKKKKFRIHYRYSSITFFFIKTQNSLTDWGDITPCFHCGGYYTIGAVLTTRSWNTHYGFHSAFTSDILRGSIRSRLSQETHTSRTWLKYSNRNGRAYTGKTAAAAERVSLHTGLHVAGYDRLGSTFILFCYRVTAKLFYPIVKDKRQQYFLSQSGKRVLFGRDNKLKQIYRLIFVTLMLRMWKRRLMYELEINK